MMACVRACVRARARACVYSCLIHNLICVYLPVFQIDDQRHKVLATAKQLTLFQKAKRWYAKELSRWSGTLSRSYGRSMHL